MQSQIKEIRDVCFGTDYLDNYKQKRVRWTKVGVMFIKDDGKINIILDAVPIGTGNLVAFEKREREPRKELDTIQVEEEAPEGTAIPTDQTQNEESTSIQPEEIPF